MICTVLFAAVAIQNVSSFSCLYGKFSPSLVFLWITVEMCGPKTCVLFFVNRRSKSSMFEQCIYVMSVQN